MPSLDEGESPELVDFRRRFWWTLPLTVVGGGAGHVRPSLAAVRHGDPELGRARAVGADRAVGGLAVLRPRRAVGDQPQPEHVDADRPGHVRGLRLQRRRHGGARRVSGVVRLDGPRLGLLRGGGRDHLADAARPAARAQGTLADLGGDQVAARAGAEDGAPHQRRRHRGGHAPDPRPRRRLTARAPGRERCPSTAPWSKAAARSTNRC